MNEAMSRSESFNQLTSSYGAYQNDTTSAGHGGGGASGMNMLRQALAADSAELYDTGSRGIAFQQYASAKKNNSTSSNNNNANTSTSMSTCNNTSTTDLKKTRASPKRKFKSPGRGGKSANNINANTYGDEEDQYVDDHTSATGAHNNDNYSLYQHLGTMSNSTSSYIINQAEVQQAVLALSNGIQFSQAESSILTNNTDNEYSNSTMASNNNNNAAFDALAFFRNSHLTANRAKSSEVACLVLLLVMLCNDCCVIFF